MAKRKKRKSQVCSVTNRLKMKLLFVVVLLLDIPGSSGLQTVEESGNISLRLDFPPLYSGHVKSCCKVYPSGCQTLLDSTGYTADFLRGRVSVTETNSWIEFKVARVRTGDRGYYRCVLLGTPVYIYADHRFRVSGTLADHGERSRVSLLTRTQSPEWTGTEVPQGHSDPPKTLRTLWTCGAIAVIALSVIVVIVFASVKGALCFTVKNKSKHLGKLGYYYHYLLMDGTLRCEADVLTAQPPCSPAPPVLVRVTFTPISIQNDLWILQSSCLYETIHSFFVLDKSGKTESAKQEATVGETSGVIYTTVDFRSKSIRAPHAGEAEYCTLAIHQ
ncbi:uncharacterized protein LOC133406961 isoform X2 [Phycodurus eques]|uniref:uncharacterized protein LOC133406961 isoform X2 n=1 Tax=Phycodurus eques TaxID=693459 RepID=UPI002ACD9AF4|nr:uncharacterized protein LOC133406961 isoform X2 [Phycodurus eques]